MVCGEQLIRGDSPVAWIDILRRNVGSARLLDRARVPQHLLQCDPHWVRIAAELVLIGSF